MEPIYYYYYYYFNYIFLQGYKSPPKKGETQIFYQTPHYLRFLLLFLSLNISKASYQEKKKIQKKESWWLTFEVAHLIDQPCLSDTITSYDPL